MMEFSTLNRHKQIILVTGYIRNNSSAHIPSEIVTLCGIFFNGDDLQSYIEKLKKCELISSSQVFYLCTKLKEILSQESNIVNINITDDNKYIIVGDVRAQFYDLTVGIFDQFGYPSDDENSPHYLFLGDYTSKGGYHTETCLLLFALKARYPSKVTLLRGHMDCRQML